MVTYDPAVIQGFAERLYQQAWNIAVMHAITIGGISTAIAYFLPPNFIPPENRSGWVLLAALVGGLLGAFIGWGKGFALRLQAQQALCQVKIEENTRKPL